jgi:hypothetical protein
MSDVENAAWTKVAVHCAAKKGVPAHLHSAGALLFIQDAREKNVGFSRFGKWLDAHSGHAASVMFWLGADADKEAA